MIDLDRHIRRVADFPKPGILFYDVSPLLADADLWRATVEQMAERVSAFKPDRLAAIESRGFLFAAPLALRLGLGFAMIRKVGKLPGAVVGHAYDLEYGSDTLQVGEDAIAPGERVVLIDDLIATGGTAEASVTLLRKVGADPVAAVVLIELAALGGMARLGIPGESVLRYGG